MLHKLALASLAIACASEPTPSASLDGAVGPDGIGEIALIETGAQANGQLVDDTGRSAPKPVVPDFGAEIRGLRLNRSIVVRATPALDGEKLGTVAAHTVVGWKQAKRAEGCEERWIEIEPYGWVCEGYLDPVVQEPGGVELPKLRAGERVPGTYGKVYGEEAMLTTIDEGVVLAQTPIVGSSTVRKRGTKIVENTLYWKIDGGKYVAEESLRLHDPSPFRGYRLQDSGIASGPLAFAISGDRPGDWVIVRDAPNGKRVRRLAPRSLVSLAEARKNSDGDVISYRIGDDEFIRAKDLRQIEIAEPPPLTKPTERWFDVDLDSQVLVAYEGSVPVYTTLISSGTRKNPTETGIFRIWIKFSETSMSGRMGESDAYSVATVPWTQFYENDFALHTSYWHDRFGQKRSHGCVNLSPRDSRFLYFWSEPQVPLGWSMANASTDRPGSMVRVHSAEDPEPAFKGAALEVQTAREARAPAG